MQANNRMWRLVVVSCVLLFAISLCPLTILGQSTFTAQLTGVVTDATGAVIPGAKVTLTDEATSVATTSTTDSRGIYVFTGIRPATYGIRVETSGMKARERKGMVLGVSQQATADFTMSPGAIAETVTVTAQAPLLDTGDASLGTDVTNEQIRDIPLPDRSFFGLVFLSGGVTETAGQGTQDSYPQGTNFVSNGQRNATAEIRLDGALTSAPEQGEGATTNVYYQPSVEIVQEFKVENNSFSAEYGNNGGTVVNIVTKEGANKFHGSGWWFGQRSALDANNYFNNAFGTPRPDHVRDQAGFSLGGPIKKGKTFFFADLEWYRQNDPSATDAIVPTDLERKGDFRQTFLPCNDPSQCTVGQPFQQHIFNPFNVDINGNRQDFSTPNVIDSGLIDPIGQAIINLYPEPTPALANAGPGNPNYHSVVLQNTTNWQGDIKIDHHFSEKNHVSGRYSNLHNSFTSPFTNLDLFNGQTAPTHVQNAVIEENWSPKATLLWTSRIALDRVWSPVLESYPKLNTIFNAPGDAILSSINGLSRMPVINMENDASTLLPQCCTDTTFAHTLVSYNSLLSWVRGRHVWKFGGEQRIFFNNFYQPNPPTGNFSFTQTVTEQVVNGGNAQQGDSYASLLLGYGDPNGDSNVSGSSLSTFKPVENKSKETAFFFQDDWKVSSNLTLNLGLRYEWSTPYTERNNLIQFSNFTGDSGIAVPINVIDPNSMAAGAVVPTPVLLNRTGDLLGTTEFPTSGHRNSPVDRNNVAPRFGFAYALNSNTVIRGGAGVYYGLNPATNFQFTGTAFGNSHAIRFTKDNFQTPFATLETPFPDAADTAGTISYAPPQASKYGADAMWGFSNGNGLDTGTVRNAEIYQWNVGVQHLFPGGITIGVDYSASRSTHLPFSSQSGAAEHNFLPSAIRNQIVANSNACFATAANPNTDCMTPTNVLATLVNNPFQCFFATIPSAPAYCPATPTFNEPESRYNDAQIPLGNLLNPYPQFDGSFSGLALLTASSRYNSMQVRFQKRPSHYISFEGNYTLSKAMDDSSAGANSFITNSLGAGGVQVLDNHKAEWSISANDATQRLVLATIVDLPVGRGRWIGRDMNRIVDAVAGGWAVSTILTFQKGTPINIGLDSPLFANGSQRPNVICPNVSSGISYHDAAAAGVQLSLGQNVDPTKASVFNASCFAFPGDNVPGNAPRYFSNLRGDGIHNSDLSFSKEFAIRENQKLQLRGEFFNFTNTPRFDFPNTNFGSGSFGQTVRQLNSPRHMQFGARYEF